jgi:hypothetical protein
VKPAGIALVCTGWNRRSGRDTHGWTMLGDFGLTSGLLAVNCFFTAGKIALDRRKECVWIDGDRALGSGAGALPAV